MWPPLVSCICPTYNREDLNPWTYTIFDNLHYPYKELLIYDDSPTISSFFSNLRDYRVRYHHSQNRVSIGRKRNEMIKVANGKIIQHLDDDDWYAPQYTEIMTNHLWNVDLVKLVTFNVYNELNNSMQKWDTRQIGRTIISTIFSGFSQIWGYGFSYVYRRSLWEKIKFPDINLGEDCEFIKRANSVNAKLKPISDYPDIVWHSTHKKSTSSFLIKLAT